ncbi:DNA-directed RNA polymerase I subunit RPA34 [Rhinatrema bivittatum]|uniref:DNA-directed RNA polymerase I subunit RPA34 n=1 Tax=Rhinatrema bivittatum TaxID=194408 RepID=UPI0011291CC5|nr:DNA-directed RNA polymerase I subunit RPA34 [Rhinatrema bivittatum]XP_029427684.1 DNA-directed RNA polymerase I subunit RPA34 [Rhinatrema bivittatum]XP_029427685.1 DNA-directed RNA polymerase I subunit RPA34 [Rhinatrema bivittatum]
MMHGSQGISSSSSDEDSEQELLGDRVAAASPGPRGNKVKFNSPPDFIACSLGSTPSFTQKKLCSSSTEVWLIKAPVDFNPDCFNRQKVPLCGFQTLEVEKDGGSRCYSIFSSVGQQGSSHLLVPSGEEGQLACSPALNGYLNICDSFSDPTSNSPPKTTTASPAPPVPAGLKQRFQPFGATLPSNHPQLQEEVKHAAFRPGKKRKGAMEETCEGAPKTKKKQERMVENCIEMARQQTSVKMGEASWGNLAQDSEVQSPSMVTVHVKKKKGHTDGTSDFTTAQKSAEEKADTSAEDKLERDRKKKKLKTKQEPTEEEPSCNFQEQMDPELLGEASKSTQNTADGKKHKKKSKKSKRGVTKGSASEAEERTLGFHENLDNLLLTPEKVGSGRRKKKKKQQRYASEGS